MKETTCSCGFCNDCINRKNIIKNKKLKEKVKKYQKIMKDFLDEDNDNDIDEKLMLNSVIYEKTKEGETFQRVSTSLGENYTIINEGKDVDEMTKSEYKNIKCQNEYHQFVKAKNYLNKFSSIYGWVNTVLSFGKSVLFLA